MGFREVPHTADWALQVWGADLPELFAEAARGMITLAGARLAEGPRVKRTVKIEAPDVESLLVAFLSEVLFFMEQEHLGFDSFQIVIEREGQTVQAEMAGAPLLSLTKAIKAVTFHNLNVRRTKRGYEVEIVFDV
ncbi:MAG: archease [Anaerolineae bacterium]